MRQVLEQMGVGGLQVCAVEPALDGGFVELSKAYENKFRLTELAFFCVAQRPALARIIAECSAPVISPSI